jgi:FdhD protein
MQDTIENTIKGAAPDILCDRYSGGTWNKTSVHVPIETEFTIYVNGLELVTILCTPSKLNCLVAGYLYAQGIISNLKEIASMRVCEDDLLSDVVLTNKEYKKPEHKTVTSGCGGGVSFKIQVSKVESNLIITPDEIFFLMNQLQNQMELYRVTGGVHASALADNKGIQVVAEDIGRHNTLDKILGECLLRGLSIKDGRLLSTGRVTSEMLIKAVKMQVPVIMSRTSPTDKAVTLANDLNITLIGYVKGERFSVYTHPERITKNQG